VHSEQPRDTPTRTNFCTWLIQTACEWRYTWPTIIIFTAKAWFYLNRLVNTCNNWQWSSENPGVLHEVPLHDSKVWCGTSVRRITDSIFLWIHLTRVY
jgi:hypothetical protein